MCFTFRAEESSNRNESSRSKGNSDRDRRRSSVDKSATKQSHLQESEKAEGKHKSRKDQRNREERTREARSRSKEKSPSKERHHTSQNGDVEGESLHTVPPSARVSINLHSFIFITVKCDEECCVLCPQKWMLGK